MACQSYRALWRVRVTETVYIVLKFLFRLTLESTTLVHFELPLHYCYMKIVITYLLYQNLPKDVAKI